VELKYTYRELRTDGDSEQPLKELLTVKCSMKTTMLRWQIITGNIREKTLVRIHTEPLGKA